MTDDDWTNLWNSRYAEPGHAYGRQPNQYFAERLRNLSPGKILLGAEGQARNAVYAARRGWEVTAFDISVAARASALGLAREAGVRLDYRVGALPDLDFSPAQFDVVALIYAHFPLQIRATYHGLLDRYLRPGGALIFEGFGQRNLTYLERNPQVGGPATPELLFSTEELSRDFSGYREEELREREIDLAEGKYHNGTGSIVRFFGYKPTVT